MSIRWTRWTSAVAMLAGVAGLVFVASCASNAPQPMTQEQKVAYGKYLVGLGSCNDCHTPGGMYGTPDTTRTLSGSELGWRGPWGVSYPRNLTPDQETGIGSWSAQDIANTIRTGHRPDGSALLPPMPWPNYVHLTDDDALAIAAYLKSLPPVSHKVPDVVPPDGPAQGPEVSIPPPPAWDAPPKPPEGQGM